MNSYDNRTLEHAAAHEASEAYSLVNYALAEGWTVSVYDGAEWTVKRSADANTIWNALATTDGDMLRFDSTAGYLGKVWFTYGNGPDELVSDYTAGGTLCKDSAAWQGLMDHIERDSERGPFGKELRA